MAIYAIGDVQGCYDELLQLLDKIKFDDNSDILWFTGDLVNRGPRSVDVLRFVCALGDRAVTVLGNHDLHCLALYNGFEKHRLGGSLDEILTAKDGLELMEWLRFQPLLHCDNKLGYVLVHAGIYPGWTIKEACNYAALVESALRTEHYTDFLQKMYGNTSLFPHDTDPRCDQLRFITNCFTRMRYCDVNLRLNFSENRSPEHAPKELIPWYLAPNRKKIKEKIVFGHWSSLGLMTQNGVFAIDTGCVWKGALTAIKLGSNMNIISQKCNDVHVPKLGDNLQIK